MKKLFIAGGVILLLLLVTVVFWKDSYVSKKDVKAMIMEHVHLKSKDVHHWNIDLEYEDDRWVYEVKFIYNDASYEYKIDARSGKILQEKINHDESKDLRKNISLEQAKTIAVNDAGLVRDSVTFTKAKSSFKDEQMVYELEFVTSEVRCMYEIEAISGGILKQETFSINVHSKDEYTSYIGIDRAKEVAVQHANLSMYDVVFGKEKLEFEHNIYVYELEFYKDSIQYEYEIDAVNGTIVDYSIGR